MAIVELERQPLDPAEPYIIEEQSSLKVTARQEWRIRKHWELLSRIQSVPGDIVECGVFKGTSLMRFAKWRTVEAPDKKLIAFDLYEDFPREVEDDEVEAARAFIMHSGGGKSSSPEELRLAMQKVKSSNPFDEFVKGDLVETAERYVEENPESMFSFLHVDVDLKGPTSAVLKHLAPRISPGGIILFDDLGSSWPGADQAVNEWLSLQRNKPELIRIPYPSFPGDKPRALHYVTM